MIKRLKFAVCSFIHLHVRYIRSPELRSQLFYATLYTCIYIYFYVYIHYYIRNMQSYSIGYSYKALQGLNPEMRNVSCLVFLTTQPLSALCSSTQLQNNYNLYLYSYEERLQCVVWKQSQLCSNFNLLQKVKGERIDVEVGTAYCLDALILMLWQGESDPHHSAQQPSNQQPATTTRVQLTY